MHVISVIICVSVTSTIHDISCKSKECGHSNLSVKGLEEHKNTESY